MISPLPLYGIFLSDPILPDGAISGGWILGGAAVIIAFFLIRFMNQVDKLVAQMAAMQLTQGMMKLELEAVNKQVKTLSPHKIADEAVAKLITMQGGSGGRHWPFNRTERDEDPGER